MAARADPVKKKRALLPVVPKAGKLSSAVAAYVRVSSTSQTAEMQRHAIERAAANRGDVVEYWFSDRLTGGVTKRPGLDEMREAARAGALRKLYVYRIDRLTRSGIADTFTILDELRSRGCQVVTLADGFELDGPASEIIVAVMAWAAKMERLAINERISAARARIESEGGRWGRPRRMTGADIERASAMQAKGKSVRAIAVALKVPFTTIARALRANGKDKRKAVDRPSR